MDQSVRRDPHAVGTGEGRRRLGASAAFWTLAVLGSGATSLLAVRLANPLAIDDGVAIALLFFVGPALFTLMLGALARPLGLSVAILCPFIWLMVASDSTDSPALWLVPLLGGLAVGWTAVRLQRLSSRWIPVAVAAVVAIVVFLAPLPSMAPDAPSTLLIGIDGATWDRIDPLVEAGRLPNMKRLMDGGRRARLRSLPSMFSPQIWSTIATGCLPEAHGIWDFGYVQSDFKVGRLWDRMRTDGMSAGTCGWYFTWPPPPGLGDHDFVVPNTLAPDDTTYPPGFGFFWQLRSTEHPKGTEKTPYAVAALRAFRHGVRLSTLRRAFSETVARRLERREFLDSAWKDRSISASIQSDMFCELIRTRRPEFAAILMNQVDKTSHLYWKFLDPRGFPDVTDEDRRKFSGAVDQLYGTMDENLGRILELAPAGANIVVVSDHGFRAARSRTAGQFCRVRTEQLASALGLAGEVLGTNVDQKAYIRPISESFDDRERTLERMTSTLRGAHLLGETRPFFEVRREGDAVRVEIAARDAIPQKARLALGDSDFAAEELIAMRIEARFSGEHHPDGIFLLSGPAAHAPIRSDSLNVLDVAPTIAAITGLAFSKDWTGSPAMADFSTGGIEYADYPPPSSLAPVRSNVGEALKEQLRSMGYLE
jgi:predicted AlkP superfamily phosphohydrolase/phosphomutase